MKLILQDEDVKELLISYSKQFVPEKYKDSFIDFTFETYQGGKMIEIVVVINKTDDNDIKATTNKLAKIIE